VRQQAVGQKLEHILEAVMTMLPPLSLLPRAGSVSCIARDAYLIARKQLSTNVGACSEQTVCKRTHESVLTRKEFMKVSADVSWRWFEVATPAFPSKKVNTQNIIRVHNINTNIRKEYIQLPFFFPSLRTNTRYGFFVSRVCLNGCNLATFRTRRKLLFYESP